MTNLDLTLWHTPNSVCAQKVRICLAEIGLAYGEYIPDMAHFEQHTPAFRKVSPDGVVPVLIDGGLIVRESSVIIEHLDETRNEGRLMPAGKAERIAVKLWLFKCIAIHAAINSLTFGTVFREADLKLSHEQVERKLAAMPDPAIREKRRDLFKSGIDSIYVQSALREIGILLDLMEEPVRRDGWLGGPDYSLADIALTAYCDRLDRLGLECLFARRPAVAEWLERCRDRASYQRAIVDRIGPVPGGDERKANIARWSGASAPI